MFDPYAYRSELKCSLLQSWQRLELDSYPLDWAWMLHALRVDHAIGVQQLAESVDRSLRWIEADVAWSLDGNLGAIGVLCRVLRQEDRPEWEGIALRLVDKAQKLMPKSSGTFSRLNDPYIVYGLVVGAEPKLPAGLRAQLDQHCRHNSRLGNWRRRVLFAAICAELGSASELPEIKSNNLSVDELPCVLWFAETFRERMPQGTRRSLWDMFASVKEQIVLDLADSDGARDQRYRASPIDVAMLYLAAVSATEAIDPVVLYRNFPLHPRVRQASESLFLNGEYASAAFEAAKVFVDEIKIKAGHPAGEQGRQLDGSHLIQHVFGGKKPILKFTALRTPTEKDEHKGLVMIAGGIVAAIRNPKGHTPKDKIAITAYEALEELVTISYMCKRVDAAR